MIMEEDGRFRHLKRKVALFGLAALLVLAGVAVLIGRQNDLFSKKYELRVTVDKGTGFSRGMPVKLSGFRIGRVTSIALNEDARVNLVLQINKKYQKWIRKDSVAKLFKEGMVGDSVVEVTVGSPLKPVLEEREELAYLKVKALDEMADEIAENVKPVLREVQEVVHYLNDPQGDVKRSLGNFRALSANLERTRQRADALILSADSGVSSVTSRLNGMVDATSPRLNGVLDGSTVALGRADAALGKLDQKLPLLLEHAEGTLENVAAVARDLRSAEQKVLPKVPTLLRKSEETLDASHGVLRAVQGTWPISSHVPAPREESFVPGDSHE